MTMSKKVMTIPYAPLPLEILPADNRFDVHLFAAGVSTTFTNFMQEVNATDRLARLTEEEWIPMQKSAGHRKTAE